MNTVFTIVAGITFVVFALTTATLVEQEEEGKLSTLEKKILPWLKIFWNSIFWVFAAILVISFVLLVFRIAFVPVIFGFRITGTYSLCSFIISLIAVFFVGKILSPNLKFD